MTTFDYVILGLVGICCVLAFIGDNLDKKGNADGFGYILLSAMIGECAWISWIISYAKEGSLAFAVMMCG
jgi:hypothetical protein